MMDWAAYGFACLLFGGLIGFLIGLAANAPPVPAVDAHEERPPKYWREIEEMLRDKG